MTTRNAFPDLLTVLVNIGQVIPPFIYMLQYIAAFIGMWLTFSALIELWGSSNDNAMKYVPGGQKFSVGSAIVKMFTGAIFIAMGTLEWMGIMSRTITGDYANSRMISYSVSGTTMQSQVELGILAMLGIMQIVGFVAMCKGVMTINKSINGQSNSGLGVAFGWMIGGICAWNLKWVADVINNTIGFNLIGIFKL